LNVQRKGQQTQSEKGAISENIHTFMYRELRKKLSLSFSFFPSEQFAGFNPSSFAGLGGPQPQPMFPEEGPGSEQQQAFIAGPQKEMASFYQVPEESGMMESPRVSVV